MNGCESFTYLDTADDRAHSSGLVHRQSQRRASVGQVAQFRGIQARGLLVVGTGLGLGAAQEPLTSWHLFGGLGGWARAGWRRVVVLAACDITVDAVSCRLGLAPRLSLPQFGLVRPSAAHALACSRFDEMSVEPEARVRYEHEE